MGRGPNATISFKYCMARAESMTGAASAAAPALDDGIDDCFVDAGGAGAPLAQAVLLNNASVNNVNRNFIFVTLYWRNFRVSLDALRGPFAELDAQTRPLQCSPHTSPAWVRQRCTGS